MSVPQQFFLICLAAGLLLIGAEIFVPGGIVGSIGVIALAGAIVMGFVAFGQLGWVIAAGIVFLGGLAVYLWIRLFPASPIGRRMTVSQDLADSKAADPSLKALTGQRGVADTELRPAGYARIGARRVDVVTEGGMVARGTPVQVVKIEGARVVVRPLSAEQ